MRISATKLSGTVLTRFTFSWAVGVHLGGYRPLGRDVSRSCSPELSQVYDSKTFCSEVAFFKKHGRLKIFFQRVSSGLTIIQS